MNQTSTEGGNQHGPRFALKFSFVVQIQSGESADAPLLGRIEHVSSGEALEFVGGESLLSFIGITLSRLRSDLSEEGT